MNTVNLPKIISALVTTQNSFDSNAYGNCFSETAMVHDEGKTHTGRKQIAEWIADANARYEATMQPVDYEEKNNECILKAKTFGNFEGSPIVLNYHLKIVNRLIQSLKITG